jgi:thiol-disulfide isomerase/thioredoxin
MKPKAIILAVFLVAALVIIGGLARKSAPPGRAVEGLPAPSFTIKDIETGKTVTPSDLRGSAVFVNFWATWCAPCVEEMPYIEKLYQARKSDPSLKIIMILYKDDPRAARDFLKKNNYGFDVYADENGASAKFFGLTGVPETFLIDKNGIVFKRILGPLDWSSADAQKLIDELINRDKPSG